MPQPLSCTDTCNMSSATAKATNQNKTYQFITSMQEIKLQGCEQRRRWGWEDVQADPFNIQMKSMKLQQTQEAGSIFINEIKNILITVLAATAVINNDITLGAIYSGTTQLPSRTAAFIKIPTSFSLMKRQMSLMQRTKGSL